MADKTHFQSFLPFNHLNNSSFNLAVYEFSPGPLSHDAVLKHYYVILLKGPNCLILALSLAGLIVAIGWGRPKRSSSFFWRQNKFFYYTLNARSLIRNFDQLNSFLGNINMPFSVIGVSETWLTHCTADLANITGYNFVSNHRKSKTGGGVGIYLQNDLEYKLPTECKFSDPDVIESLF